MWWEQIYNKFNQKKRKRNLSHRISRLWGTLAGVGNQILVPVTNIFKPIVWISSWFFHSISISPYKKAISFVVQFELFFIKCMEVLGFMDL